MSRLLHVQGLSAIVLLQCGHTLRRYYSGGVYELKWRAGEWLQREGSGRYQETSTDVIHECMAHEWWCEHD